MTIVLENVRSSWNVGSIFRTCDALGFDLVLIGYTPRPTEKNLKLIHKTALGAENTVKWKSFEHPQEVFTNYKNSVHLAIEISKTSQNLFEFLKTDYHKLLTNQKNIMLWFGNEIHGLNSETLNQVNSVLHLDMQGQKESLNVASCVCSVGYLFNFCQNLSKK
jgi:23S rRNA (guanosine2251-2'-O)-methyltransferase